jgi:hypothetical protein
MDSLFGFEQEKQKSYRAIRHDIVRTRQKENCPSAHHPDAKQNQIRRILEGQSNLKILELFAGQGGCTIEYKKFGCVVPMDKKHGTGDSFIEFHRLIADKNIFDVVDADPYGFPNRLLPDVFLLLKDGYLFLTLPIASINILHDITKTHLFAYFGNESPTIEEMIEKIALFGLCHWRKVEVLDLIKIDRLYRVCFKVQRIKATEYTGVRNR